MGARCLICYELFPDTRSREAHVRCMHLDVTFDPNAVTMHENVAPLSRSSLLPLSVYSSDYKTHKLQEIALIRDELLGKSASPPPPEPITATTNRKRKRMRKCNETTFKPDSILIRCINGDEWVQTGKVDIAHGDASLDRLDWIAQAHKGDQVHPHAFSSVRACVPCPTLGWDQHGRMLHPDVIVATRSFRCAGLNGCEPHGKHKCCVRMKHILFNRDPCKWTVWRFKPPSCDSCGSLVSSVVDEGQFHCPSNPSSYRAVPTTRPLGRELKKDIRIAVAVGQTAAKFLMSERTKSFVVKIAMQNGVDVSSSNSKLCIYDDARFNPSRSKVARYFACERARTRLHKDDATACKMFMQRVSTLSGVVAWHQVGNDEQAEITILTTSTLLELALTAAAIVIGLDAGHGIDAYGHKSWEITGRNPRTGSGVPLAMISTSDGATVTQCTFLAKFKYMAEVNAVRRGLRPPTFVFAPVAATIDKDILSLHALRDVWPNILIVYCLFHLLMWLFQTLHTKCYGVARDDVQSLAMMFRSLANQPTESEFDQRWRSLSRYLGGRYPSLLLKLNAALFNDEWVHTWPVWVRYAARLPCGSRAIPDVIIRVLKSNMLSEAAVRWTKYIMLNGVRNHRKDKFLEKSLFGKLANYEVESAHIAAGLQVARTSSGRGTRQKLSTSTARARGVQLARDGNVRLEFTEHAVRHYSVLSSDATIRWEVVMHADHPVCECPQSFAMNACCKHINAVRAYCGVLLREPAESEPIPTREAAPAGSVYRTYGSLLEPVKKTRFKKGQRTQAQAEKSLRRSIV